MEGTLPTMPNRETPLVSILTPSLDQGAWLPYNLRSVACQTYPAVEHIVMDGGSTDETAAVVAEYGDRLTWISEKDRGQSHAINKGFRMARGEIVAWINSDDILLPGAVAKAVAEFEKTPELGVVYGEGYLMDEAGEFTCRFPATVPFDLWKLVHVSDYILQQSVFFRRAVFDEIGFIDEDLHYGMDWDILIRIGKRFELRYIPEFMGALREYGTAKTFAGGHRRFVELVRIVRSHTDWRLPPAFLCYGVDTYERELRGRITCIERPVLRTMASLAALPFIYLARFAASLSFTHTQGIYPGGWAARRLHYMLPAGRNRLRIRGEFMRPAIGTRAMEVRIHGFRQRRTITSDPFELDFELPIDPAEPTMVEVRLHQWTWPFRRFAFRLHDIR